MKQRKFTICYRHLDTEKIFCDHAEGRTEAEAAMKAIEARVNSDRAKPFDKSVQQEWYTMAFKVSRYKLLFAFRGHQKQLL